MTEPSPAIVTDRLAKTFPSRGGPVEAVRDVSLRVESGEIFGLLGPNGAGKTTTMRMLTTLLPIDAGQATVAGFDVDHRPRQVRQRIGYVSQLGEPTNWPPERRTSCSRGACTERGWRSCGPGSTSWRPSSISRASSTAG